jgi:peptidoglycan/xylan/chitin deacetylase (PgdA/CDA1 family)
VYLTFDDGPHPQITHFVLDQLDRYDASATFFCIGKNVVDNPGLYERLARSRHAIGNHTYDHLNGSKVNTEDYLADIAQAAAHIDSRLFRPPYGRIRRTQALALGEATPPYTIVMWSLLSADFDTDLSPQKCLENVVFHAEPRHIIVFHDSLKAAPRLEYALPRVLEHCHRQKWKMAALQA